MPIIFRKAIESDLAQIINIVKTGFQEHYIDMMIWGCAGISSYFKKILAQNDDLCDLSNYVAAIDDNIIAIVQLKRNLLKKQLHLNYICTSQAFQGNNFGSHLLKYSILAESSVFNSISLDVFIDNKKAKQWYSDMGFKEISQKHWFIFNTTITSYERGYIANLPQSETCYSKYGFSQFDLITNSGIYSIGLLGEKYFRISDQRVIEDVAAMSSLAIYSSTRKILLITGNIPQFAEHAIIKCAAVTIHMSTDISTVMCYLTKTLQMKI